MRLVLASASPRRSELLRGMGIDKFDIIPSKSELAPPKGASPEESVCYIAAGKAKDAARECGGDDIIIAADTLVFLDGKALGKPKDAADAAAMLSALSGRSHQVITGLAVMRGELLETHAEVTTVHFREMTHDEIEWYVSTGEPLDKAGAYGIQGLGGMFISGISGDYYNVVGLPVCPLNLLLQKFGFSRGSGD